MLEEGEANGLLVDRARKDEALEKNLGSKYSPPDPNALAHESIKGAWNFEEFAIRRHFDWTTGKWGHRMNLWRRRTIPRNSLVDESAYQRSDGYTSRLPGDSCLGSTKENSPSSIDLPEPVHLAFGDEN
jgi:hypothetical protein